MFYGRQDLPSRFGRSGDFSLNSIFFLVAKMTPLKTQKFAKKSDVLLRKVWKSILSFSTLAKNGRFYMLLANYKKEKKNILPKWKIWVRRARKTGISFSWPYGQNNIFFPKLSQTSPFF